tara:strand:- start:922 stop:1485 length:564 start_codon:yes stop_codon:yes gene_type:complete
MNNQNLVVFNFPVLFEILSELEDNLNFKITKLNQEDFDITEKKKYENFLFLTRKKNPNIMSQYVLSETPFRINKLVEILNIEFLKLNFQEQSNFKIGNYVLDLNSKLLSKKDVNLKLTEREIATILYLFKKKKPTSIKELQSKVWDHKSILETHTVETHIHRLRKKIKENFNDQNFVVSLKEGYKIE